MTGEVEDHPKDECECGDWRSDHTNGGPCRFNGRGFDACHGGRDCMSFRLIRRAGGMAGPASKGNHPMTDQPTAAIVSQRDREIAADIWRDYVAKVGEVIAERCMREGGLDDGLPSILAAFAAEIEAATIERCAGAAANHYPLNSAMRPCGTNIATAIRNLKGQTS